jgi:ATP-dependent Clp protease ATP-binding subunit ClpB
MEATSMPVELDEMMRRITQLEIEREALRKEQDPASQERLRQREHELANLHEEATQLRARWQHEVDELNRVSALQQERDAKRTALEQAKAHFDWEQAAKLQYEDQQLERQVQEAIKRSQQVLGDRQKLVKEEVEPEDIAAVVSMWTGIPVARLLQGEMDKLVHMEERLREHVVGQEDALVAVANAVRTARGAARPQPPAGQLPLPRPNRRRQD